MMFWWQLSHAHTIFFLIKYLCSGPKLSRRGEMHTRLQNNKDFFFIFCLQHEHKPPTLTRYSGFITLHACALPCRPHSLALHGVCSFLFLVLFMSGDSQTCACVVFSLFFFFAVILWNVAAGDIHSWKRRPVSGDFAPQIGAETHALLRHIARLSLFIICSIYFLFVCVFVFSLPHAKSPNGWLWSFLGKFSPSLLFISPHTTSFMCELNVYYFF